MLQIKHLVPLFFCLLLSACASNVTFSARGCRTNAYWAGEGDLPDFYIEQKVWTKIGQERRVLLKEFLDEKKIKCSQLKSLSVTMKSTWQDVLVSVFPLITRKTVSVSGKLKNN